MNLSLKLGAGGIVMPAPVTTQTLAGPIQHIDAGQGEALLSLNGGLGGFDQSWLLTQALFAEAEPWRVLALSRPGYLGTPLSTGRIPQAQADAYAALLDRLGIERAVVTALSAGGPSAVHFAARHPDRCKALILVSAVTGRLDIPSPVLRRLRMVTWLVNIPAMQSWLRRVVRRDPMKTARWSISDPRLAAKTLADPQAGRLFLAFQEGVAEQLKRRLPGTINDVALFRSASDLPFRKIKAPVLIVHGTADAVVPFSHAERLVGEVPHARLCRIEGGEHAVVFTHLDDVRAKASAFLVEA